MDDDDRSGNSAQQRHHQQAEAARRPSLGGSFLCSVQFQRVSPIALLAAIGGFISCCLLYYRELYHFIIK